MPKPKQQQEGVSWLPDDQEAGGGLITDVDVDFKSVTCEEWDYNGKADPIPALHITMVGEDGEEHEQYISCGNLEKIVPSDDGTTFVPAEGSSSRGIPATSNGGIFMRSLGDAGFPFTNDLGLPDDYDPRNIQQLLQGGNYHILRIPAPKRPGIAEPEPKAGKRSFPKEVLTVTKVNRLPWEKAKKAGGKATATTPSKGKAKPAADDDDEAVESVIEVVTELLQSKKYAKSGINIEDDLANAFFAATKQRPDRKALMQVLLDIDFESRDEFTVDDGVLTLA